MDESTAKNASKYINEIYDNLSYYDIYGTTVIQFILLTLFVFYIYIYSKIIQNKEDIINDWTNQRCNPKYIPFAGFISHPEGTTAFDYTAENFNYCIQNIQNTVVGQSLEPFNYLINNATEMLSSIGDSTQKTRELLNLIRQHIKIFVEDIMYRIVNVTIPLQTQINSSDIPKLRCFDPNTLLEMNDGTYKKIINMIAGDILANNVIVTAKIKVDAADLRMYLLNNIIISESHIVNYQDQWIAIRDHPLAKELPKNMYTEPYLYCLNTSSKEIIIDNMKFTDWDEIYDDTLLKVIDAIPQNLFINDISLKKENIHKYLDEGFEKDTRVYLMDGTKKHIKDVSIGDKLSTKGIVYGIVEIKIKIKNEKVKEAILGNIEENGNNNVLYHLLISNKLFETDRKIIRDYNDKIDFICHKKII
jgi:hypothetical protein